MAAMIQRKTVNGHVALSLENDRLRVVVLPEKGGDIFEFAYKGTAGAAPVQFLMRTPWGLNPPGERAPQDFLDNYEGGWQELFPNANDGCQYRGADIPFHGEVALERWEHELPPAPPGEALLLLRVDCRKTPFRLERAMCLQPGESRLTICEKVTNMGSDPCDFVWGHHITLGGDFLEDGCQLDAPAHAWYTPEVLYEPLTARLQPGCSGEWPFVPARQGSAVDLRHIPGPQCRSHDDVILGGLERGFYRVVNPRLNLAFSLEWDSAIFPWLMLWQPYGGADLPPLTGIYGIGLEPWISRYPLAKAVEAGQARRLEGGESLETELIAAVQPALP